MSANRSTHQSSHVMMLSHHIGLYPLVEGKNAGDDEELQPNDGNAGGAS
jgi:hypothetical protein